MCRVCHIQYGDLENNIHDFEDSPHSYWSEDEYNKIVNRLDQEVEDEAGNEVVEVTPGNLFTEGDPNSDLNSSDDPDSSEFGSDEEIVNKRGVKAECPLNILESFHSIKCFPPDVLHDIFEGIIPEDLLGVIRILSSKNWFSLEQYNNALIALGYSSHESGDKPCPVQLSSKVKKLKGKAVSNWVHLRNFPLVINRFVIDNEDPVLDLALKLHQLVERLCAYEFYSYEVSLLQDKIIEYLDLRKIVRNDHPDLLLNPKPKHHLMRKLFLH